jgi:hypothetical protein
MLGLAGVAMAVGLARYAQRRAPPPKRPPGMWLVAFVIGVVALATLSLILVLPLVIH